MFVMKYKSRALLWTGESVGGSSNAKGEQCVLELKLIRGQLSENFAFILARMLAPSCHDQGTSALSLLILLGNYFKISIPI